MNARTRTPSPDRIFDSGDASLFEVQSKAAGPSGLLPLNPEMLRNAPSGDLFGWTQNAGMGWDPSKLGGAEVLLLSTHGGVRAPDGRPIALGYHTGHWEVNLLVEAAARELQACEAVPFAGFVSDPCDGRTQGTTGMFDSLPYRNDAATVFRRLIRSLPTRAGVIGVATCDKGLPAMMMALAGSGSHPLILVPGGVTLAPEEGEDAGKVQSIGARFAHGEITLEYAAEVGCKACASPGGGCQFLGTAATSQVVAEALGLTLPHAALAPSGHPIWKDMAVRSARALLVQLARGLKGQDFFTSASMENALVLHAAFGGSTNLVIHTAAVAYHAGLRRPTVDDWSRVNRQIPRIVDALPNGPKGHPTVQVFQAGGVPEVMLHLRRAGLLNGRALTVTGASLNENLDWWEQSERRATIRRRLRERDGIDPDDVILSPDQARARGLTSTVCFPVGNLAPGGAVIKSTAIDPSVVGPDNVYRKRGPVKLFRTEPDAIAAIKRGEIAAGDVLVLFCRGPMGSGMEETFQLTSALRYLPFGKHVALLTDARFSGVSTGACIGHITPEALAGGPLGKLVPGDIVEILIDRQRLEGRVDLVGHGDEIFGAEEGARVLAARPVGNDLAPDAQLPEDTRLWAALQEASGGTWAGSVFDVDRIVRLLEAGKVALGAGEREP
jgi:putative YjhG/YagF family dehydratase